MSELICAKQLAVDLGINEVTVASYILAAKLKSQKLVIGKEAMTLFDKADATAAVQSRVNEEKRIQAAKLAQAEAEKIPTLKDVMLAIKSVAADVSDVAELDAEIKRLAAANKIIFDVLKEFKTQTQENISALKNIIVSYRDELNSRKEIANKDEKCLRKVAVVGIASMFHSALAVEYEGLISLKLIESKDIRGIYALRGYEKVFLMKRTTDNGHVEQLKSIKAPVQTVIGSIEELKEKLTAYCIE